MDIDSYFKEWHEQEKVEIAAQKEKIYEWLDELEQLSEDKPAIIKTIQETRTEIGPSINEWGEICKIFIGFMRESDMVSDTDVAEILRDMENLVDPVESEEKY